MLHYIRALWDLTRERVLRDLMRVRVEIALLRSAQARGEITTTVIVTALMAIAAIVIIAIIVAKLTQKANSIDLGYGG